MYFRKSFMRSESSDGGYIHILQNYSGNSIQYSRSEYISLLFATREMCKKKPPIKIFTTKEIYIKIVNTKKLTRSSF